MHRRRVFRRWISIHAAPVHLQEKRHCSSASHLPQPENRREQRAMSFCSSLSSFAQSFPLFSKLKHSNGDHRHAATVSASPRFKASADVPDFLSADWYCFFRNPPLHCFMVQRVCDPQRFPNENIWVGLVAESLIALALSWFEIGGSDSSMVDSQSDSWLARGIWRVGFWPLFLSLV